ncbi:MAG: hypothetical protein HFJ52_08725 [Clostridia bacterium]|jgi:hypothetical protein|nr:hypothetical protein [Clostridia bacterium]
MLNSKKIQAINHFTHTAFDIVICNGKVVEVKHWRIRDGASIECRRREDSRVLELFADAIGALCHDNVSLDFTENLCILKEDEEYYNRAQQVMAMEAMNMSKQLARLTRFSWLEISQKK